MVALAQMVSSVILASVLVATLAQHVRQVCIIHDVEKSKAMKINPACPVQGSHVLTKTTRVILIC